MQKWMVLVGVVVFGDPLERLSPHFSLRMSPAFQRSLCAGLQTHPSDLDVAVVPTPSV